MSKPAGQQPIATLWHMSLNENEISCAVYRQDNRFQLRVESPTATIISEPFDMQPRAMARAHALRESLKRRGWTEAAPVPPPASDSDA